MLVTQTLSWPLVNWPTTTAATQYTVLQVYPAGSTPTIVSMVKTNTATISYDESQSLVYQVRPSSTNADGTLSYGSECGVFVVGYVPCRAWLRQKVRQALADRADQSQTTINWPDDELNNYIQEALTELNILFPLEEDTTIQLQAGYVPGVLQSGVRDYPLPADFYLIKTVEYITADGKLHLYLKEKPFRGGESTASSYLGFPKLGILLSPMAGRYYPGHYDVYENQLHIDWDPAGDGDYFKMRYLGKRPFPVSDADLMNVTPEDMTLLSLRTQMQCWLRIEGMDTRLSRWRTKDEGSRRDDMPTLRHSAVIKQLYNELVNDRRELRPNPRRLVRR